jgi:hypothetical protein
LKNADDSSTMQSGDIIVTDQNAKSLSQAPQQPGKPATSSAATQPDGGAAPATSTATSTAKRKVRVVGPPFLSANSPTPNQH